MSTSTDQSATAPTDRRVSVKIMTQLSPPFAIILIPNVPSRATVGELKSQIHTLLDSRPTLASQLLIYRGRPMARDGDTLQTVFGMSTSDAAEEYTIHLVIRDLHDAPGPAPELHRQMAPRAPLLRPSHLPQYESFVHGFPARNMNYSIPPSPTDGQAGNPALNPNLQAPPSSTTTTTTAYLLNGPYGPVAIVYCPQGQFVSPETVHLSARSFFNPAVSLRNPLGNGQQQNVFTFHTGTQQIRHHNHPNGPLSASQRTQGDHTMPTASNATPAAQPGVEQNVQPSVHIPSQEPQRQPSETPLTNGEPVQQRAPQQAQPEIVPQGPPTDAVGNAVTPDDAAAPNNADLANNGNAANILNAANNGAANNGGVANNIGDHHDPNAVIIDLTPLFQAVWLFVRVYGIMWLFLGGTGTDWLSWRMVTLILGSIAYWAYQAGAIRPEWIGWVGHRIDRLLGFPPAQHGMIIPGAQPGADQQIAQMPQPAIPPPLQQPRNGPRTTYEALREFLRPVERTLALFLASLFPGVGERHVDNARRERELAERMRDPVFRAEQEDRVREINAILDSRGENETPEALANRLAVAMQARGERLEREARETRDARRDVQTEGGVRVDREAGDTKETSASAHGFIGGSGQDQAESNAQCSSSSVAIGDPGSGPGGLTERRPVRSADDQDGNGVE